MLRRSLPLRVVAPFVAPLLAGLVAAPSTATATPAATLRLAAIMASPIDTKYAQLGGSGSFLGNPTTTEKVAPDGVGKYRHYEHGSIYWSPTTGAMEVHGLIRGRWAELGWEKSWLGYPMTDEIDTYDGEGRVTKFEHGELIWRKATNAVSEVRDTDLQVDLPTKAGERWKVIQANGLPGSHNGKWVYCYDLIYDGNQPKTKGREFVSSATARVVWADDGHTGSTTSNVIAQKLGTGRYASTLHLVQGSYQERFGGDLGFVPQALPWSNRPVPASGAVLGETGDVGAANGAYHIHYCITTAPDVGAFKPFESVPFVFRNYETSKDGSTWVPMVTGRPRTGDWVRRKSATGSAAKVTAGVDVLNFGSVTAKVIAPAGTVAKNGATIRVSIVSPWGEPLASKSVAVTALNTAGPWTVPFSGVPNYGDVKIAASIEGGTTPYATMVTGESAAFDVKANTTKSANVTLQASTVK